MSTARQARAACRAWFVAVSPLRSLCSVQGDTTNDERDAQHRGHLVQHQEADDHRTCRQPRQQQREARAASGPWQLIANLRDHRGGHADADRCRRQYRVRTPAERHARQMAAPPQSLPTSRRPSGHSEVNEPYNGRPYLTQAKPISLDCTRRRKEHDDHIGG